MATYLAFTIGPINRTLALAGKTRELWGASYFFSYLSRSIIRELLHGTFIKVNKEQIINPGRNDHFEKTQKGTGLYPDRIFVELDGTTDKKVILEKCSLLIKNIIKKIANDIENPELAIVLQTHIKIYYAVADLESGSNIFSILNSYLASFELQERLEQPWTDDYPFTAFTDAANGKFFLSDAFQGYSTRFTFPSIPEISTVDLKSREYLNVGKDEWKQTYENLTNEIKSAYSQKISEKGKKYKKENDNEDSFLQKVKTHPILKRHFRAYHKYFCIVHADGDSIGKAISTIGNDPKKIRTFTKRLFKYSLEAIDEINDYGGTTVYAGGDDLLFFAPVVFDNGNTRKTIFDLINRIDEKFLNFAHDIKSEYDLQKVNPSLSFGLSITYYKYPLNEALKASRKLLFDGAKSNKQQLNTRTELQSENSYIIKEKDSVAFKLFKHSGQNFGFIIGKSTSAYKTHFNNLLTLHIDDRNFLSSIQYKLHNNRSILEAILTGNDGKYRSQGLSNFFSNNFNEKVHNTQRDFLNSVRDFILSVYDELNSDATHSIQVNETLDKVYAALRFVHFINQKGDE